MRWAGPAARPRRHPARPATHGRSEPLAHRDWLRGAAGGRLPALGDRLAGGREPICSGATDEGFPGREEKREAKKSGGDKGWGRRGASARSPGSSRAPGGTGRGRRIPAGRAQDPRPRSQRAPPWGLSGRPGLGPPPQHSGQRGSGDEEPLSPSSGFGTQRPDLRTRSAAWNLAGVGAPAPSPGSPPPLRSALRSYPLSACSRPAGSESGIKFGVSPWK